MPVEKRQFRNTGPLNPINWAHQGACNGMDTDMFYPEAQPDEKKGWVSADYGPALQVCMDCPVRVKCLDYALATDEEHGVWGGYTPDERRSLKKSGLKPGLSATRTGTKNSLDLTTVASMLAKMDYGKPSLGRSRLRTRTSPS